MDSQKSFLGTGWAFPIAFHRDALVQKEQGQNEKVQCSVEMVSEVADIRQSLTILLGTRPGERVMRPDYGCALDDMLFEPINTSLITYIKELITNAVLYYEPRVNLQNINIVTDPATIQEGRVLIELDLVVRSTNGRFNYVYDYYKREATIQPKI